VDDVEGRNRSADGEPLGKSGNITSHGVLPPQVVPGNQRLVEALRATISGGLGEPRDCWSDRRSPLVRPICHPDLAGRKHPRCAAFLLCSACTTHSEIVAQIAASVWGQFARLPRITAIRLAISKGRHCKCRLRDEVLVSPGPVPVVAGVGGLASASAGHGYHSLCPERGETLLCRVDAGPD
jgi:hypothetical protein